MALKSADAGVQTIVGRNYASLFVHIKQEVDRVHAVFPNQGDTADFLRVLNPNGSPGGLFTAGHILSNKTVSHPVSFGRGAVVTSGKVVIGERAGLIDTKVHSKCKDPKLRPSIEFSHVIVRGSDDTFKIVGSGDIKSLRRYLIDGIVVKAQDSDVPSGRVIEINNVNAIQKIPLEEQEGLDAIVVRMVINSRTGELSRPRVMVKWRNEAENHGFGWIDRDLVAIRGSRHNLTLGTNCVITGPTVLDLTDGPLTVLGKQGVRISSGVMIKPDRIGLGVGEGNGRINSVTYYSRQG
ncbi:MAG: hypothetical protein KGH98_02130 [Candidatus Micrarchaeota archaeon]|nr:hypothetical protein [Candidatus Micrarchaeota archaeon]